MRGQQKDDAMKGGWLTALGRYPRLCRLWRSRDGVTAVEFALVAPFILIFLMLIVEFGRFHWYKTSLQYSVEQVARAAMAQYTREFWADDTKTDSELAALVETTAEISAADRIVGWDPSTITFTGTPDTSTDPNTFLFQGSVTFTFMVPFIPASSMTISASTRVPLIKFDT